MKLARLTDIHLNFLNPPTLEAFLDMLAETEADAFAITGDIGEADDYRFGSADDSLVRPLKRPAKHRSCRPSAF